jgi:hypothetical protein
LWRIVAAPALLCAALAAPAEAAPEHAEIAFVSGGKIWAARADGSERRLLVSPSNPGHELSQPVWSPDGARLAYVSAPNEETAHLMVLDGNGTRAITPLRTGVTDFSPAWAPDGSALAFTRAIERDERYRIQLVAGTRVLVEVRLDGRLTFVGEPAWSPDGSTIAYTRSRLGRDFFFEREIRTIPATGGPSRVLIPDAGSPAWSPDGRRLAFSSIRDRNGRRYGSHEHSYAGELYTAAADGTGLTRLTRNQGDDGAPAWSPDGSRILFTSDRSLPEADSAEVYSIAPDGGCLTWLTNGTPASGTASWRPDSGTRFDPGSCDPASRPALIDPPVLPSIRSGVWLGPTYRGLLLSRVDRTGPRPSLSYLDCERFQARDCPPTLHLLTEPACGGFAYRFLQAAQRYLRVNGALVAYHSFETSVRVLSGHAITMVQLDGARRLGDVLPIVRNLRPYAAADRTDRLPPPRIPRRLARRLEQAARAARRHSTTGEAARALGIPEYELHGRLDLRHALRGFGPYRFTSCRR